MMNIEKIKKVFDQHMQKYNSNDFSIKLKYKHSYRVMYLCKEIAKDLGFKDKDIELAMIIGLLHDYGRFEQWQKFKTFNDIDSVDHGDLAVKKLFNDNHIDRFDIPISYYQTIYEAIKYHNKYELQKNISERNEMFCKIVRDADKLDIFYLMSIGKIPLLVDDSNISEILIEDFLNEKSLRKEDRKTNNDRLIFSLAMMYDLNFKYSYQYIKDNAIIEKLFNLINKDEKFETYFNHIDKYIEEGSKQYVRKKI